MAASTTPRKPAPERPPPPVPVSTPPPPLETPPSPSPSSQPGEEYHTPPPSLDASPRAEASFHSNDRGGGGGAPEQSPPSSHDASPRENATLPTKSISLDASPRAEDATLPSDGRGREAPTTKNLSLAASPRGQGSLPGDARGGGAAPAKSPTLSPVRLPPPPPVSPSGQNGKGGGGVAAAGGNAAAQGRPQLRLATSLVRTSSQGSLATKSPSPSPSPTPPSPLTPATPPVVNSNNKSTQTTPRRAEARKARPSPGALGTTVVQSVDPDEEAATSPLRLGKAGLELDNQHHHQQQQQQRRQQHVGAAENGGDVPPDVAAVAAVGERRALSVTLRLATAVLSLAAFSVIASARTTGWTGDSYARHQQYRYAVAVNVIVCAYSIAQSFGEIRRLISPTFIFRSMSSYYCSLFLDQAIVCKNLIVGASTTCCLLQVLAYLLMSASSAAASRNDLWVSRFGTDAFNRKISSALWLSFIGFLMLSLNALISTANLFSMI
ncbi:hypothetical protein HU200_047412 [Digitaria exilis]|uniref:CASP-like protein n=1 Tax=Digitaria exilis TaxID=1010633 RepID=A0A835AY19_9POAL|nr:hypothetical protein HU200_047412 [Digitaria exilis]CAB3473705.1 unnamed protein product [Digitaria exilis]